MAKYFRYAGTIVLLGAIVAPAICFADSIEDVEKQIRDAYGKLKSYSANVNSQTDIKQGGQAISMTMTGSFLAKNGENGKHMYRMEGKTSMKMPGMDHPGMGDQELLVVCDGEYTYQVQTNPMTSQKNVIKTDADADPLPWAQQKENHTFKVLPDEKVDGQDCFVVEATPKTPGGMGVARTVFYIRKDIGALVKQVAYNTEGEALNTTTFNDVKVNPDVSADQFKFEVPEGVTVMDRTTSDKEEAGEKKADEKEEKSPEKKDDGDK
ncbi:MAG TPA: outer membrane lipoprotein-sorting protein [Phycisphaerae bacterium]|nr:outer membrane lipoprotein carrier protein LolA [Phycisphaerales bacterium]HRX83676.1 outer membrane lipoprotein-sorting protein [Phycisphaerae bacterium]